MPQILLPASVVFQSVSLALIDRQERLDQIKSEAGEVKIIPPTRMEKLQRLFMPWVYKRNVDNRTRDLEAIIVLLKEMLNMAQYAHSKDMIALEDFEFELLQANLPSR